MELLKHKIISGGMFDNDEYCVVTEDYGQLFTKNEDEFNRVMKDGFIELEYDTIEDCI